MDPTYPGDRKAVPLQFSFRPRNPVGQPLMMQPPDPRYVLPASARARRGHQCLLTPPGQPGAAGVSEDDAAVAELSDSDVPK
jgi:hypothetical protein